MSQGCQAKAHGPIPTTFTGHYAAVGNPSHIVFLDLAKEK
jgi:hypothetical protein